MRRDAFEIRGDETTRAIVPGARPAQPDDYGREFLAPILAVRVVGGLDEVIAWLAQRGYVKGGASAWGR